MCVWVEEFQPGGFIICFSRKKGGDVGLILLAKDETTVNDWCEWMLLGVEMLIFRIIQKRCVCLGIEVLETWVGKRFVEL